MAWTAQDLYGGRAPAQPVPWPEMAPPGAPAPTARTISPVASGASIGRVNLGSLNSTHVLVGFVGAAALLAWLVDANLSLSVKV